MLKIEELRNMDEKSLRVKSEELKREFFKCKLEKKTSGLKKPHLFWATKKDVARVLMVLNEKVSNS